MQRATVIIVTSIVFSYFTYQILNSRTFQFFGHLENATETNEKVVALTFDDGPYSDTTYEVLNILEKENVTATFFLTGNEMESNKDETLAIIDAGHELGNHSYYHSRLIFMSYQDIESEIEDTNHVMQNLGYEPTGYVRSPYCKKLFTFPWYLVQSGQTNVTWTLELETYCSEAAEMVHYTLENVEPGDIILLHVLPSGRTESRDALEDIISGLKDNGYDLVTVSELLENY